MVFSYSKVECYESCPFKYYLRYVLKLKTKFNLDPSNPLVLGTTVHKAIQEDLTTAIKWYYNEYPSLTYLHILEMEKLLTIVPGVTNILDKFDKDRTHELMITDLDFIGFIDTLIKVSENEYILLDYKYASDTTKYKASKQLHVYKYYFEKLNPGKKIIDMFFVFIPKVNNPMFFKGTSEDLKENIREKLKKLKFKENEVLYQVDYDSNKVIDYFIQVKHILEATEYPKNAQKNCQFCEFKKYCQSNGANKIEILEEEF